MDYFWLISRRALRRLTMSLDTNESEAKSPTDIRESRKILKEPSMDERTIDSGNWTTKRIVGTMEKAPRGMTEILGV